MRGARFWRPDAESHLKKCSEFVSPPCDPVPTDGCCAVIPCSYCLQFDGYIAGTVHGVAHWVDDGWEGEIDGLLFRGYWERNYTSGECEFVVTLAGDEVYRNDCYGGQSCRDSSDSVEVTIGYDTGLLMWTKVEPRPLEYVIDEDTYCRKHFCGTCECTCECLCVTITPPYQGSQTGEICDTAYACDGPRWEGIVGDYAISVVLERDAYDLCILTLTIDGETLESVQVADCQSLAVTFTAIDGTEITVRCKICDCSLFGICCDRQLPLDCFTGNPNTSENALPVTLTMDLTATASFGGFTCFNGSGTLTFKTAFEGGVCCWEGTLSGNCTDCNGAPFAWALEVTLCCDENGWLVNGNPTSGSCQPDQVSTKAPTTCDPVLIDGCFDAPITSCFVGCLDDVTLIPSPTFEVCFLIYETP